MTPAAQRVYDRILAVAAKYPDLATRVSREGDDRLFSAGRMIPLAEGAPRVYLGVRMLFHADGRIDAESLGNGAAYIDIDFDWRGLEVVARPYAADSADRAGVILRRALDSIRRAEMPDRIIYRSMTTFEDILVEKGPDGLYRERAMTDADRIPA